MEEETEEAYRLYIEGLNRYLEANGIDPVAVGLLKKDGTPA